MATKFKYPRVNISTVAKIRSVRKEVKPDTTVLFQPIYADRGPADEIVKLYSTDEFEYVYGAPDFRKQGQAVLNALNWLKNGGTVYAYRLTKPGITTASVRTKGTEDGVVEGITAKYPGTYYNNISVTFSYTEAVKKDSAGKLYYQRYNFSVSVGDFESFGPYSKLDDLIVYINDNSEYIKIDPVVFALYGDSTPDDKSVVGTTSVKTVSLETYNAVDGGVFTYSFKNNKSIVVEYVKENNYTVRINGVASIVLANQPSEDIHKIIQGATGVVKNNVGQMISNEDTSDEDKAMIAALTEEDFLLDVDALTRKFYGKVSEDGEIDVNDDGVYSVLANKLETPIDIILDAGYSEATKKTISAYTDASKVNEKTRSDIIAIFDTWTAEVKNGVYSGGTPTEVSPGCIAEGTNRAVYQQYIIVDDPVASNVCVTSTYALAKLIPANDIRYGVQWPTAGLTRGVISNVKNLNKNPSPSQKNAFFLQRINYIERDINGCKFMSQRTFDGSDETEYTALSFLNNARCLAKIVKELEKLGREYLFEFNDTTTLENMRAALNRYIGNWLTNRTLNYASITVEPSPYSDEAVDVTLNIRFTGTIEVISIDIIIE